MENRAWPLPERLGSVALRANGGLIGAFASGFKWIDPDTLAVTPVVDPEPDKPGNRFNDGKCDRRGRLFAGTMDNEEVACTGTLYRLDPDLSVHVMATDVHLSNGLDWSPDDRVMYYTDSLRHVIWVYDFDLETGEIGTRRVFAEVPAGAGVPDGLCVDAEGFVWSAHWGGWRVTRYGPDGRIDRVIELPASQITCPTFGGPDLDVLYVSSAAIGMSCGRLRQGARRRRPVRARCRRARPGGAAASPAERAAAWLRSGARDRSGPRTSMPSRACRSVRS